MDLSNDRGLDRETADFYARALETLDRSGVPFLLGGAYALTQYTGIVRHTKDLDVFMLREHVDEALDALAATGLDTERSFPHWLAKAKLGDRFIDLIYGSGNGVALVDHEWFEHAHAGVTVGRPVLLIPPEEMIWSKAWVQERERYDGADIAHLLQANAERIDWAKLVDRFGGHWRVLLAHLTLFGFIYPGERQRIPQWVMHKLMARLAEETRQPAREDGRVCAGTLLSREQYLHDVEQLGYVDGRLTPVSTMTPSDVAIWTEAIPSRQPPEEPAVVAGGTLAAPGAGGATAH